jgi:hypothetical protein
MAPLTRRELLKAGGAFALAAGAPAIGVEPAPAQTPKPGGIIPFAQQRGPPGVEPHQTV